MRVIASLFALAPSIAMAAVIERQDASFDVTGTPTYEEVTVLACSTDGVQYTKRQDFDVTGTPTYREVTSIGCPTLTASDLVTTEADGSVRTLVPKPDSATAVGSPTATASDLVTIEADGSVLVPKPAATGTNSSEACLDSLSSAPDTVWVKGIAFTSLHATSGTLTATIVPFSTQTVTGADGHVTVTQGTQLLVPAIATAATPTATDPITACQASPSSDSDKLWVEGVAYTSLHATGGTLTATMIPFATATVTAADGQVTTTPGSQALAAQGFTGSGASVNAPVGLGGAAILGAGLLAALL